MYQVHLRNNNIFILLIHKTFLRLKLIIRSNLGNLSIKLGIASRLRDQRLSERTFRSTVTLILSKMLPLKNNVVYVNRRLVRKGKLHFPM